jgi:hypothetical protein
MQLPITQSSMDQRDMKTEEARIEQVFFEIPSYGGGHDYVDLNLAEVGTGQSVLFPRIDTDSSIILFPCFDID